MDEGQVSDTPETDAVVASGMFASHWWEDRDALIEKSRQLERRLAAATLEQQARPSGGDAIALLRRVRSAFPDLADYEDGEGNSLRPLAEQVDRALKNAAPQVAGGAQEETPKASAESAGAADD